MATDSKRTIYSYLSNLVLSRNKLILDDNAWASSKGVILLCVKEQHDDNNDDDDNEKEDLELASILIRGW